MFTKINQRAKIFPISPVVDLDVDKPGVDRLNVEKSLSKNSSPLEREYQKAILHMMEKYNNGMYRKPSQFLREVAATAEEKKRY